MLAISSVSLVSKKYSNYPFFMKLRKKRGSLLLFVTITSLCLLQTFQAIFLPYYLLIGVGFFYFINDDM
ncbi:hypothetical protein M222_0729 [Enterococcus faecalis AZ19]|nr:hypothetical protein M222_0729 [Enterococcus faecalis AZ19]